MITDPAQARPRPDLGYLRRRSRPPAAAPSVLSAPSPPPAAVQSAPSPALSAPVSASLDLDAPPTPRAAGAAGPSAVVLPTAGPLVLAVLSSPERLPPSQRLVLTGEEPSVTLTRLQSGIGTLTIEAACGPEAGDVRLGCAYELDSRLESLVQPSTGHRFAPPGSRRPVLIGGHARFEQIGIDLRQCRTLRRAAIYLFSERRAEVRWGGTLVVTTFGGARVEIPLEPISPAPAAVVATIYDVDGEYVLRGEWLPVAGGPREAARSFGYDRLTWVDDRTPVE